MSPALHLVLTVLAPLAAIPLIAAFGARPNRREAVTLVTAALTCLLVAGLLIDPHIRETVSVIAEPLPGLPLALQAEPLGLLFAAVASGLWFITSVYSIGYMRGAGEKNQTRFYIYFAVSISAALGVALSANLFTLFVFYEALTLSTYPLVTHKGTEEARRGGRVYLGLLISTSIGFLLLAMIWTWLAAGTLDFVPGGILRGKIETEHLPILLALYMFGIGKAALMPFHRWLPSAMVAPTPVSALLHAVAVVKAGVFTVLKVTVYIFGTDLLRETDAGVFIMWVAAVSLLTASLIALTQDNLKLRLAYSTVSQLSYVTLGAMLASAMGIMGGALQIATHAVGKITLFFCAGAIYVAAQKTEVSELDGLGRTMPFTFGAFFIASLSIIGLPPMGGSWSKWYLMLGAADAGQQIMILVLMVSSLLNVAYLLPVVARGFFAGPVNRPSPPLQEAPWACVVPLSITAIGCVILFFFADPLYRFLLPLTE